jgi:hypothetical protein
MIFNNNTISGGTDTYAIQADPGSSGITASGNTLGAGTKGTVLDLGSNNSIQQN